MQSLINDDKVFALFNVVGTKNNLAIRNTVNTDCVPDLLIASGAVQWGNKKFPWMLGSELVPYPLEMRAFVDYLKEKKPNATIALLKASDDFGQSYEESLRSMIKGTGLKIKQTQSYDAEGADVKSQMTSLAATKADAFVIGAALPRLPAALSAKGRCEVEPDHVHVGHVRVEAAPHRRREGRRQVAERDPAARSVRPHNDSNPAMQLYKSTVKKYSSSAGSEQQDSRRRGRHRGVRLDDGRNIRRDPAPLAGTHPFPRSWRRLRTLAGLKDVGLQLPGSSWSTSTTDWFIGEDFQLIQYNLKEQHFDPIGSLINDDGKTASLSPTELLNN